MESKQIMDNFIFKKPLQEAMYYFRDKYKNQVNSIKISELEHYLMNKKQSIYILGKECVPEKALKNNLAKIEEIKHFLKKMKKFTYTRKFKYNDRMMDDVGWSCTLRSGQMLLMNLIVRNLFKKNRDIDEMSILNLFLNENDFSISNILKNGETNFGKKIDEQWSQKEFFETCAKVLTNKSSKNITNFKIVNSEGIMIKEEFLRIFEEKNELLLILNLRLGVEKIDKENEGFVFELLKSQYFCGGVGGKKNSAYYIFGLIKDKILYLDPHKIRNNDDTRSFKVCQFNYIKQNTLHPSFSVAFFFENKNDFTLFENFVANLHSDLIKIYNEADIDNLSMNQNEIENMNSNEIPSQSPIFDFSDKNVISENFEKTFPVHKVNVSNFIPTEKVKEIEQPDENKVEITIEKNQEEKDILFQKKNIGNEIKNLLLEKKSVKEKNNGLKIKRIKNKENDLKQNEIEEIYKNRTTIKSEVLKKKNFSLKQFKRKKNIVENLKKKSKSNSYNKSKKIIKIDQILELNLNKKNPKNKKNKKKASKKKEKIKNENSNDNLFKNEEKTIFFDMGLISNEDTFLKKHVKKNDRKENEKNQIEKKEEINKTFSVKKQEKLEEKKNSSNKPLVNSEKDSEKKSDSQTDFRGRKESDMSFLIIEENSENLSKRNSRKSIQFPHEEKKPHRKSSDSDIIGFPNNKNSFSSLKSDKDIENNFTLDKIILEDDEFLNIY